MGIAAFSFFLIMTSSGVNAAATDCAHRLENFLGSRRTEPRPDPDPRFKAMVENTGALILEAKDTKLKALQVIEDGRFVATFSSQVSKRGERVEVLIDPSAAVLGYKIFQKSKASFQCAGI